MAEAVFWASAALVVYGYLGYPVLLRLRQITASKPVRREPITPSVSMVVCARNEEAVIGQRIENLLALEYPAERLELIVISDGSTDETDNIVRRFAKQGVRLLRPHDQPRGKASALNAGFAAATGEIVVVTDARQRFAPDAVARLVANFADPQVGAVGGALYLDGSGEEEGVSTYWRYEQAIRQMESDIHSLIGVAGAISAYRKGLLGRLPENTILDDMYLPYLIYRAGYRVVYEPAARAWDPAPVGTRREWERKVRTQAGNFQLIRLAGGILNPRRNPVWFQFLSHKVVRLIIPYALLIMLGMPLLIDSPFYDALLALQIVFYGLALIALTLLPGRSGPAGLLSIPRTMVLLNATAVAGLFRFLGGNPAATWEKG